MAPKIIENGEFIEVIGHYDDKVFCAKMTLLADLYAVEHREGYAKFPATSKDKLNLIDSNLEFFQLLTATIYLNNQLQTLDFMNDIAWSNFLLAGSIVGSVTPPEYTIENGNILYDNKQVYYNGVPVTTNNTVPVVENGHYNTPTTKLTFDLSNYPGWQALTPGQTYAITLIAHDNDGVYADSDQSAAVNVLRPLDYVYDFSNPPVLILRDAPYSRSAPDAPAIKIT